MSLAAEGAGFEVGGRSILGPVDLAVSRGELLAVVGPNGAGKTTLLRLLAGVRTPTRGSIRLEGEPLGALPPRHRARRIAYVPQLRPLNVPLVVRQLVALGRYPFLGRWQRVPSAEDRFAVDEALERVGLTHLADRRLDRLSGGERQAAYLAAALAQQADILVLDEPSTHLDPKHQVELASLLRGLHDEGRTIVVSMHDIAFAAALAERILVLRDGRVAACDPTSRLLDESRLAELFGAPFELRDIGGLRLPRLRLEAEIEDRGR